MKKYRIEHTSRFKRQLKLAHKRHLNVRKLLDLVNLLATSDEPLPERYRNHRLVGSARFRDCWECHIEPDWLLVYRKDKDELILLLLETGTHSDLFGR